MCSAWPPALRLCPSPFSTAPLRHVSSPLFHEMPLGSLKGLVRVRIPVCAHLEALCSAGHVCCPQRLAVALCWPDQ